MRTSPPGKPIFSIVTCTWNSAATLADTLASVQAQTCQDIEHIFVDGGSTDATLEMIAAYPGNKRLLRDVQGGISRAMNQGIEAARGEIVAHLHSDDYYKGPEVLATVRRAFEQQQAAGRPVEWVYGNIQVLKDGKMAPPYAMPAFSYRALVSGRSAIAHPAVFVRRAAFERVGMFDEQLKYAMDIDLWLRLGAVALPAMIDQPLAVFRDHAGSVSSSNRLKARQEEFTVRRRHMDKAPLAFGIYCLRYLKRLRALQAEAPAVASAS
ncbi:glycosyltransferase family 2 protein [Massilia yuzhufengensis]|uniref:Glycosyltransferase, GT2 family n=1 Tax=Massilia yuzhufengensis TaxID=1164594 RepID=A0A1I1P9C4_9BURK|nr:glycosyltransferase family 2 protein [Massilia yuzhufengensis]SFD06409.1 Glycosyltransferase, GT2 family [Massilia yuzhufengensis]